MKSIISKQEFAYLRDFIILDVLHNNSITLNILLSTKCQKDSRYAWFYAKNTTLKFKKIYTDYIRLSKNLFPYKTYLVPTFSGKKLRQSKFLEHARRLLSETGAKVEPLSEEFKVIHLYSLFEDRFYYQRPRYQIVLASALMSLHATRPSEIAQLEKRDINIAGQLIILRKTKGQEQQRIPIHPEIISLLEKFIKHLPRAKSPLFVRSTGKQWNYRDITRSLKKFGETCGISDLTGQKMRPSVVIELHRNKAPLHQIQSLTRHKQLNTLLDHYITPQQDDARKALSYLNPFPTDQ
jgi:integrase